MIKTNYHTHNSLCDGKGRIEDYIVSAVDKGLTALGFSSHAPLPVKNDWTLPADILPVYLMELNKQKIKWKGRIQIYTGLEIDYIPGYQMPGDAKWTELNLDYTVGSVHTTVGLDKNPMYRCIDGSIDGFHWLLDNVHAGSVENLCSTYYSQISELIRNGGFDILGHFDLVKKWNQNNGLFSESAPWYRRQVLHALDVLADNRIIMEVNSGAISKKILNEVYPSPWILAEAFKRNIPTMINADAHRPQDVDYYFEESRDLLKDVGYKEAWALLDNQWTTVPL